MKCEAINPPCNNEATHVFELVIHSNIFAGVHEIGNRTQRFNLCEEHYNKAIEARKNLRR